MNLYNAYLQSRRIALAVCLAAALVFLVIVAIPPFKIFGDNRGALLSTHLIFEMFATTVSVLVVVTMWNSLDTPYTRVTKVVIFGFTAIAGCNLLHAITDEGMPLLLVPSNTATAIFLWLAGRFFEVVTLTMVAMRVSLPLSRWFWQATGVLTIIVMLYVGSYHLDSLPALFSPGAGVTKFERVTEYVFYSANLALAWTYWRLSEKQRDPRPIWVATGCFVMGLGGLTLINYTTSSGFQNVVGHLFKVTSYLFLFKATLLASIQEPYVQLQRSRKLLTKKQGELESIMQHMQAGITRLDAQLNIVYVNEVQADFLGRRASDLVGTALRDVLKPELFIALLPKLLVALEGRNAEAEWGSPSMKDVNTHFRTVSLMPERAVDGEIIGCIGLTIDVTEKHLMDQKLKKSMYEVNEIKAALDAHAIVAVTDAYGKITRVNDKFCKISQFEECELAGNSHRIVNSGQHPPEFFHKLWRTISRGRIWNGEICNRAKDGSLYWVYTTIVPFVDADGKPVQYISIHANITERKRIEQKAQHLAFFDPLTALPNRRLLLDLLQQSQIVSQRNRQHGSLIFLDLDHFKDVNDTLGHNMGDLLLNEVAMRLTQCVRRSDTVSRFGGDEFVVVLNGLGVEQADATESAGRLAATILESLNKPFRIGSGEIICTPSLGVVMYQGTAFRQEELLQQADMALYQAKGQGRNGFCFFDPALQAAVTERAHLESQLRQAIANAELRLYYQPIVDSSRQITGVEALVRWHHSERGVVSPAVFIPLAEKSNLILGIGNWVLQTACMQLASWSIDLDRQQWTIAVNVSARQFRQAGFVKDVLAALERSGANPAMLKLEITESMLLNDLEDTIEKMKDLRRTGVRFALDDFGTGYSSLSYLKKLPLTQLKIDKSFVRDVESNPNDAAIARTILSLAGSLDLGVVAEGVETQGQLDFLLKHGCRAFQGYLFGRPTPVEDLPRNFTLLVSNG